MFVASATGALLACGSHLEALPAPATSPAAPVERWFRISYLGHDAGWARERETRSDDGLIVERREYLRLSRLGRDHVVDFEVTVHASVSGAPTHLTAVMNDGDERWAIDATWTPEHWRISEHGKPLRLAPATALPSELVPWHFRRAGAFSGPVLLSGERLALAHGQVAVTGPHQLLATVDQGSHEVATVVELSPDGETRSAVDSTGTALHRTTREEAQAWWPAADVVALASIDIGGAAPDHGPVQLELRVEGGSPPPPALPGQQISVRADAWQIVLDPALPGSLAPLPRSSDVTATITRISDEVSVQHRRRGGDCTAHATGFVRRARAAGIHAQVVTGYILEDSRLIRHRWAVGWSGERWISVDPTAGEGEAPWLLGLFVHDDSPRGLAAATAYPLLRDGRYRSPERPDQASY
jgi:hypothetical protein